MLLRRRNACERIKNNPAVVRKVPPWGATSICGVIAQVLDDVLANLGDLLTGLDDLGGETAQFRLGLLYRNGRGVPQVRIVAAMWLRRASDQGHAEAASQLGDMRGV